MGKSLKNLLIILFVLVVLGVAAVFFSSLHPSSVSNISVPTSIFVSLVSKKDPLASASTYTLNPETGELTSFLSASSTSYIGIVISPDSLLYAYTQVDELGGSVILIADSASGDASSVTGDTSVVIRRNPTWSPLGGALAYEGRSNRQASSTEPNSWSVYYYDLSSQTEKFLTTGMNPVFTPSGQLIVLRNDGLYMVDPIQYNADGSTVLVKLWEVQNAPASTNMRFAISFDGSHLAWVSGAEGKIDVISISSWFPFVAEVESKISNIVSAWPVFSPDGLSLAYAEADGFDAEGMPVNPRITKYDLVSHENETLLDLAPFETNAFFITDWK